jgi:hypothetical protein
MLPVYPTVVGSVTSVAISAADIDVEVTSGVVTTGTETFWDPNPSARVAFGTINSTERAPPYPTVVAELDNKVDVGAILLVMIGKVGIDGTEDVFRNEFIASGTNSSNESGYLQTSSPRISAASGDPNKP